MTKYYVLRDGIEVPVTKQECFAKNEAEDAASAFKQRWYMEEGICVRLPRTEDGEKLFLRHVRDNQREAKQQERKCQCVLKGTNRCTKTCDACPFAANCESMHQTNNGLGCVKKCEACTIRNTSRTVELDMHFGSNNSGEDSDCRYEPVADCDVAEITEAKALLDTLHAALALLTEDERTLIDNIFTHGKTERELAPTLGLKEPKSVNKRKQRILEILRNNDALKSFFE